MTASTSRRALLGASAGAAVLAGAIGAADVAQADGHLLALTAEIATIDAAIGVLNDSPDPIAWDDLSGLQGRFWSLADQVIQQRARTPQGMQAKARVLRSVHQAVCGSEEDVVGRHMHSLVRDMLGEG